jgi:uncharacterized protein (TIRG00374 family)
VFIIAKPALRTALQVLVSVALIGFLVSAARQNNLSESLAALAPSALALAFCVQGLGFVLSTCRWQLILRDAGIDQPFLELFQLYLMGLFFSLFLPTGTGGDAVRMYQVARRSGRTAEAIIGTFQERLLGLGASLLVGLLAMLIYLPLVPEGLRIWVAIIAPLSLVGVSLMLYPRAIFAIGTRFWQAFGRNALLMRLVGHRLVVRVVAALQPIHDLPPLPLTRFILLLVISVAAILSGITMYYMIGRSLDLGVGFMAFCLVVPLVWIIRMAPVSLGGIGVGEGSFVFLMSLFAVNSGPALALALTALAIQTSFALLGGALLALRMARGSWSTAISSGDRSTTL